MTSSLVGAVCKGLPILSPAWVLASKAAEALLPIGKFLLRDQYREQHWGVDLAATVAKARRGVGVLEGKQVVFRLDSNFGDQQGEEGTLSDYKALVKMAGGTVVNEGTNGNGKVTLMVVDGKDMEEVEGADPATVAVSARVAAVKVKVAAVQVKAAVRVAVVQVADADTRSKSRIPSIC